MDKSGHVHCEFWGTRTSANLFTICCNIATTLGIVVRATDNVDNMPGGDESSFDFDIIGNCTVEQFQALTDGIRENGIRVKEAQLGESPEDEDESTYNGDYCDECGARLNDDNLCPNSSCPLQDGTAEPSDGFLTDAEADADVLRSAGMGTDEDYGYYGGDEDF